MRFIELQPALLAIEKAVHTLARFGLIILFDAACFVLLIAFIAALAIDSIKED